MKETWANKRPKLATATPIGAWNVTNNNQAADKVDQVMETEKSEAVVVGDAEAANNDEDDAQ